MRLFVYGGEIMVFNFLLYVPNWVISFNVKD